MEKSLDELLEEWHVGENMCEYDCTNPIFKILFDWYSVSNNQGIVAYFKEEKDAFSFRLNKINSIMNG